MILGKNFQKELDKIDLAYEIERAYPELNFFEVNMKTKLLISEDSRDTLRRIKEAREYHKKHPEIPWSQIFRRFMTYEKPKLVKDAR